MYTASTGPLNICSIVELVAPAKCAAINASLNGFDSFLLSNGHFLAAQCVESRLAQKLNRC